jgi:hypothetical protein
MFNIIMRMGSYEDAMAGVMMWESDIDFDTSQEALNDFVDFLLEFYIEDNCDPFMEHSEEDIMEWLHSLPMRACHTFFMTAPETWNPFGRLDIQNTLVFIDNDALEDFTPIDIVRAMQAKAIVAGMEGKDE